MDKELHNTLVNSGLSEAEAAIYVAGIKLGHISMARLATKVGISRQTAYEAVKRLESKGLALTNQKEYGKKVYMAELEKFGDYLEKRKKQLTNARDNILKLATHFKTPSAKLPNVRFFENIHSLKRGWRETLETKNKRIYSIMPIDSMMEMFGTNFADEYIKERIAKGITSYSVRLDNPELDKRDHPRENRQVRYLSPEKYDIPSLICIFDSKVMIITSKSEQVGLIIESDEISRSLLTLWKSLWEQGKSLSTI